MEVSSDISIESRGSENRLVESTSLGNRRNGISGESDPLLNVRTKRSGKVKDANRLKSRMVPGDGEASGNCWKEQQYQTSESQ